MNRELPVVMIDQKHRIIAEPEWIVMEEIIKTSSIRSGGKSVPVFETSRGLFMWAMGVDDIPKLFSDSVDFIKVDRGSVVNKNYDPKIDEKLKQVILKDDNGREIRADIAGGRMESIKECFRKLFVPK